jgi:hypothetical protein
MRRMTLKMLKLFAFRYREQHDFFNFNPFDESEDCPAGATPEQQFQHANIVVRRRRDTAVSEASIHANTVRARNASARFTRARSSSAQGLSARRL